jgi:hypothetical protein
VSKTAKVQDSQSDLGSRQSPLPTNTYERATAFYLAFSVLLIVDCIPFMLTQTPAVMDYPNHLARVYILIHRATEPWLQQYYQINWKPIPNLGFDVLGILLAKVFPIFFAGQIVMILTVLIIATGVAALSSVLHDRPQSFCLIGHFFIFSEMFTYGLINVLLGFGICLWGIALWLRLRRHSAILVIAIFSCIATVLYFTHLFAFAAYALILTCIEASFLTRSGVRAAEVRSSLLVAVPQFVLPAAIFLLLSPAGLKTEVVHFGPLLSRVTMVLSPIRNYSDKLDLLTLVTLGGLLVMGILTKRLVIARAMRPALIVLAITSLLIPNSLASGSNAQIRLPTLSALVLAASCRWQAREFRGMAAAAVLLASLFFVRTLVVVQAFERATDFVDGMRVAISMLPSGSKVGSITFTTSSEHRIKPEWLHYICLAIIEKSALVPSVFASPTQQPLLLASQYRSRLYPPEQLVVTSGSSFPLGMLADLDYLIAINERVLPSGYLPVYEPLFRGNDFTLYRVFH